VATEGLSGGLVSWIERFARFRGDSRGSVIVAFAIAAIPLMLMVALAIDYGRARAQRQLMQTAADAAALAAAQTAMLNGNTTQADRAKAAARAAAANLRASSFNDTTGAFTTASGVNGTVAETEIAGASTGYRVTVTANVPAKLGGLVGLSSFTIRAAATAAFSGVGSGTTLELAMALDNTGSMMNDMAALRAAAQNLATTVFNAAGQTNAARIAVVPYVAAVNPGLSDMSMIDTTHATAFNGIWFANGWMAYNAGCIQSWSGSIPPAGSSTTGDSGADASDLIDLLNPFRRIAGELFGVNGAQAQNVTPVQVTPNTSAPFNTSTWNSNNKTFKIPKDFIGVPLDGANSGWCLWLANPGTVSNWDLFQRTLSPSGTKVAWKGCVEARATNKEINTLYGWNAAGNAIDYDASDKAPSASDPFSLFTPYFWPDEPDYDPNTWAAVAPGAYTGAGFHNNYMKDGGNAPLASWNWTLNTWSGGATILTYDSQQKAAIISESGGMTYGPNAACPDPVQRLTTSASTISSKISNLTFWYNGGTVISEGLMWAWRALSPNAPYSDGVAYQTANNKKVIVLMTDGVSGLADNGGSQTNPHISDYSAYGYLGGWRLKGLAYVPSSSKVPSLPAGLTLPVGPGLTNYDQLQTYLDDRLLAACANARNAGVTIYTVLFNHTASNALSNAQQAHSQALLQQCSGSAANSFLATESSGLTAAFASIAATVTAGTLHLIQ